MATPVNGKLKKNAQRPKNGRKLPSPPGEPDRKRLIALFLIPLAIFLILQVFVFPNFELKELSYSEFYRMLTRNPETGEILSCELVDNVVQGKLTTQAYFQVHIPYND